MAKPWTPERRAAQSARIRATQPWKKSTGPKTRAGKKRVSQNARKHGEQSAELKNLRKAITLQREFIRLIVGYLIQADEDNALPARTNYKKT